MNQLTTPAKVLVPTGYGRRLSKLFKGCGRPDDAFILDDDEFGVEGANFRNLCWAERPLVFGIRIFQLAIDDNNRVRWICYHVGPFAPRAAFIEELRRWGDSVDTKHLSENAITVHFNSEPLRYDILTF